VKTPIPLALRHCKRRGEWVETLFLSRAIALGFRVCRPWGDSARYDFIIERDGCCLRVQVKSSAVFRRGQYRCPNVWGRSRKHYGVRQIDFLLAYIVPLNTWYVIPARALRKSCWIGLYPHIRNSGGRYEGFREAWPLLKSCRRLVEGSAGMPARQPAGRRRYSG
jgi:hypothetical protein